MKNRSKRIIVFGVIFPVLYRKQERFNSSDLPIKDNLSPKQIFVNQIKADLKNDLEKAKNSGDNEVSPTHPKTLGEGCDDCRGWRLWYRGSACPPSPFDNIKERDGYIFPNELEPADWTEIDSLLNQIEKLNEDKRERGKQKWREKIAEINEKITSNQKLFCYEFTDSLLEDDEKVYRFFRGSENGQKYFLMAPENHSSMANLPSFGWGEGGCLFLIEGVEKIPLEKDKHARGDKNNPNEFQKWVKLTDQITINPYVSPNF